MALMATHIRFALEKREEYGAIDMREYVSGSMYPDSRYFTGIDRALTHPTRFSARSVSDLSDFEKGWYAHLVCDLAQGRAIAELFAKELEGLQTMDAQWSIRTALKALRDIEDARMFDVRSWVAMAVSEKTPNGERVEAVQEYYAKFRALYALGDLTYRDELRVWEKVGMAEEALRRSDAWVREVGSAPDVSDQVKKLYAETVRLAPVFEIKFFES